MLHKDHNTIPFLAKELSKDALMTTWGAKRNSFDSPALNDGNSGMETHNEKNTTNPIFKPPHKAFFPKLDH